MKKANIVVILFAFLFIGGCGYQPPADQGVFTAEATEQLLYEWIEQRSPTYTHDGFDLSRGALIEDKGDGSYVFEFTFTSSSAGYGDRSEVASASVITPHTIRLETFNGDLFKAVTDGIYDEYSSSLVTEDDPAF